MDREKLQQNPIPSYLYFGYQGQSTTCGYCAENDHLERDCNKKANMKILVKKSKMQRRVAAIPNDSESEMEKEISPTHEEASKSFERNDSTTQKEEQKKEASKRPLSDSNNTPPSIQPQKKKTNFVTEKDLSELFEPDSEINSSSSTEDQDLKLLTDPCCYACERQYYKCKCGWKTIGREKGAYKCDNCREIVANCVSCGSFQVKKKGKTFSVRKLSLSAHEKASSIDDLLIRVHFVICDYCCYYPY